MGDLLTAIPTGMTAFTATNMDDILMLLLFFAQVNTAFRKKHIVTGQYLGFGLLVLVSLPGFFGSLFLPRDWIGMLGVVPIAIGLNRLFDHSPEEEEEHEEPSPQNSILASFVSPQTYSVAAITFANGGDNIGIYMPLFASTTVQELAVILGTFFSLVGVWCYTAYRLTQLPMIAQTLTHYGNQLVPFVLIGLGVLILVDSHTLENRGLTVLTLIISLLCVLMFWYNARSIDVSPEGEEG
jgi:cadmium resistance transport/sequestration family protein